MRQNLEREVKLRAPAGFTLPDLPGGAIVPRRFTSTYFDTEDMRLAAVGITLRRRVENRKGVWQLKIPQGKRARLELEEPGGPTAPPRSLATLLVASLRGERVAPVAKLRTARTGKTVTGDGRNLAEVVLDSVQALNGTRIVDRFAEVEVEVLDGSDLDLDSIVSILKSAGAYRGDERPKLFQILHYWPAPTGDRGRSGSDLALVQGFIKEQFETIVAHDAGTRVGADPEDLHQQRVGIRKLRSLLRSTDMLDPEWSAALSAELEWIGDALNPVRDLDVMIPYLSEDVSRLPAEDSFVLKPFLAFLESERVQVRERMLEALNSDRYFGLLDTLEEATRSIKVRPTETDLHSGAARRFRKLRKAVNNLSEPPGDEELHRVRRLAKKSRYAAEVVLPAEGKAVGAFMKRMKVLQDLLGDFQDSCVAEARIRAFVPQAESLRAGFALGRLAQLQAVKKSRALAGLGSAWKEVNRSGKKAWQ